MSEFLDKANEMTDTVKDKIEDKQPDSFKNTENAVEELADDATSLTRNSRQTDVRMTWVGRSLAEAALAWPLRPACGNRAGIS